MKLTSILNKVAAWVLATGFILFALPIDVLKTHSHRGLVNLIGTMVFFGLAILLTLYYNITGRFRAFQMGEGPLPSDKVWRILCCFCGGVGLLTGGILFAVLFPRH